MSWTEYQVNQDPDLPVRSDDVTSEDGAGTSPDPGQAPPTLDLEQLAERLLLPLPWIEEVDWLLHDRRAIILTGPPGSGKTFLARALAEHYAPGRNDFLQFHPSYSYEDFVEGYRPLTGVNGQLSYGVVGGPLRESVNAAIGSDELHALVIDEINRANLSKVLGELFFALEYRDTPVRSQYGGDPLSIPSNLLFIGTMNAADRSIASFDAALRRRFHFVECDPTTPPFDGLLRRFLAREGLTSMDWLADLLQRANTHIPDPSFSIGPSHLMRPRITTEDASRIWTHSVWPYVTARFGTESRIDLKWENIYAATIGAIAVEVELGTVEMAVNNQTDADAVDA